MTFSPGGPDHDHGRTDPRTTTFGDPSTETGQVDDRSASIDRTDGAATPSVDADAAGADAVARALGLELDARAYGMGMRSQRYAAVIEDGVLKALNIDEPGEVARSGASSILQSI